jgi:hypothetical protein
MSRTKEELERVAAERDSQARAEITAQAQAVESKTSRLKRLRLAKEAADKSAEVEAPARKRKER